MNGQTFRRLCDDFHSHEWAIYAQKTDDYQTRDDELQNFREVSQFLETSPSMVCLTYLLKHIQSIKNATTTSNYSWDWVTRTGQEGLKQRIADARNYLLLLAACLEEEVNNRVSCNNDGGRPSSTGFDSV